MELDVRREEQAINTIREEERWNVGMIEVQMVSFICESSVLPCSGCLRE